MVTRNRLLQWVRAPLVQAISFFVILSAIFFWRVFFRGEVLSAADLLYRMYPWHALVSPEFQPRNPWMPDTVDWMYPSQVLARQAFEEGRLPLWNPYASSGTPLATMVNYGLFYPFTAFFLFLPVSLGVSLHAAARFVLAGVGLYLLARETGLSHIASLLGGVVYAFCGFNVVWVGSTASYVSATAPLVFFVTHRLFRTARLGTAWGLALSVAVMVAGGFVSVAAYYLYALGAYALSLAIQRYSDQGRDLRQAVRPLLLWGAGVLAGLLLISMQLLPFLELTRLTSYDERRTVRHTAFDAPHTWEMTRLVVPEYYGHPVDGDWWTVSRFGNFVEGCGYVGILPWFLALFGLWNRRAQQRWFFLALAIVSFGMVYYLPWRALFIHLPVVNSSSTRRVVSTMALGLAMLAAAGSDALLYPLSDLSRKQRRIALWGTVALAAAMVLLVAATDNHWWRSGDATVASGTLRAFLATPNSRNLIFGRVLSFLFWLGTGVTVMALGLKRLLRGLPLAAALLSLVIADLFLLGMRFIPTLQPEKVFPTTPAIEWLQSQPQPARFAAVGDVLWPSTPSVYNLEDMRGHNPLRTDRYRRILTEIDPTAVGSGHGTVALFALDSADFYSHWLDVLGVEYMAVMPGVALPDPPEGHLPYEIAYEGPDLVIYHNPRAAPRFYVAQRVIVEPDEERLIAYLESADFRPGMDVLVEEEIAGLVLTTPPTATVQVRAYEPERVNIEVEMSAQGLLVTAEQFYPGWRATVDGEAVPIIRANYDFRAVVVPAGHHVVEFTFFPASFAMGLVLAGLATVVMMGSMLVTFFQSRAPETSESPWAWQQPWAWWRVLTPLGLILAGVVVTALVSPHPVFPPSPVQEVAVALYGPNSLSYQVPPSWPERGRLLLTLSAPAGPTDVLLHLSDNGQESFFSRLRVNRAEPTVYEVAYTRPSEATQLHLTLTAPAATFDRPAVVQALWDTSCAASPLALNGKPLNCLYLQVRGTEPHPRQWFAVAQDALEQWWWEGRARISQQAWQNLVVLVLPMLLLALALPFQPERPSWLSRTVGAAVLCLLTMLAVVPVAHLLVRFDALVIPDARLRIGAPVTIPLATSEPQVAVDLIAALTAPTTHLNVPGSGYVESRWFDLPDGRRPVLWMHTPSEAYYALTVPAGACLHIAPALHPEVWDPERGDGVEFVVRAYSEDSMETLYDQVIDPKNSVADRHWFDTCLPLDRYAGREITLALATYPLQSNDWDWAGWGNPAVIVAGDTSP